jgi:hypothetical protein
VIASDDAGALYLVHSGRIGGMRQGRRKADFRTFLSDGVWCPLAWPDGKETEAPGFAHLPECNVCDGRSGYRPQLRSGPGVEPYCGATAKITCGGSGSTSGSGSCAVMSSGSAIPCR